MSTVVVAASLILALIASTGDGDRIVIGERTPALVIVALPRGATPETPATELTRAADLAFRTHTGLDLRASEQAGIDGERLANCDGPGRLACWLDAARPGQELRNSESEPVAAILAITVLPVGDGRDRLALTLIDTERSRSCVSEAGARDREARERAEDCIWAKSARTEPAMVSREELARFFSERIQHELAPLLESMHELEPFGRVRLDSATPDVELRVDGVLRGTLRSGRTVLEEVRPGRRILGFARPGLAALRVPVQVERAQTATASIELLPLGATTASVGRRALMYTGAATAAAGIALGIYAIVRAGAVDSTCLAADVNAPCTSLGAPTFSLNTGQLPSVDRDRVNPPGVPISAVAAGVGFAGAGWLASALFLEDDDGFPWVGILTGLGAGALGAGVAIALDPR